MPTHPTHDAASNPDPINAVTRRTAIKTGTLGVLAGSALLRTPAQQALGANKPTQPFASDWHLLPDRVFIGGDHWANPMEDWVIRSGRAECLSTRGNRNLHLITRVLSGKGEGFAMSVSAQRVEAAASTGCGFRIGIHDAINDPRGNTRWGRGIDAGFRDGRLVLGDQKKPVRARVSLENIDLSLIAEPAVDGNQSVTLSIMLPGSDSPLESLNAVIPADALIGNVALQSSYEPEKRRGNQPAKASRFAFGHWSVTGNNWINREDLCFGPILWTMHTLSDNRNDEGHVLKLSAILAPMHVTTPGTPNNDLGGNRKAELQTKAIDAHDDAYQTIATAQADGDAWTAVFRIPNWDATQAVHYRVLYQEAMADGSSRPHTYDGTIRADPALAGPPRPLVLGALTCQKDYGYPYKPVCDNLLATDPDLLFFSGDQLYEDHGGYGLIRFPADRAILNYLRKLYQHGWSFREAMRDRPTLCLPDDHDVFHGNIWGEGGQQQLEPFDSSSKAGYIQPARMVEAVHRTTCAHHPDFYDPMPIKQGMSVYYGDMVFGRVSFAILGDRQFKSGPHHVDTGSGRADHVHDLDLDPKQMDLPGLQLLGERQEAFLKAWAQDWRKADMKMVLSETVFTNMATHHGKPDGYLVADLDSGGWPQSPRNKAIRLMRKAHALHVNGDQHLTSLTQYGVDQQQDGNWAFCTPAIAAGYPRWWRPDEVGLPFDASIPRPQHNQPNTGAYEDGFGNKVYVQAVGNPALDSGKRLADRYQWAHNKGSGFALIHIDTAERTFGCEAYRFKIKATDGNPSNLFPGWPVKLTQAQQYPLAIHGHLPEQSVQGINKPVVLVYNAENGELVYAIRSTTPSFKPWVFADGTYTVKIGDPDTGVWQTHENQKPK